MIQQDSPEPSRDPGSYIGNQTWNGVRSDPLRGTHNGHLSDEARQRRAIKNARRRGRLA